MLSRCFDNSLLNENVKFNKVNQVVRADDISLSESESSNHEISITI